MRLANLLTGGFPGYRNLGLAVASIGFCSLALQGADADLPIHATIKDVKGSWTFYLTPPLIGAVKSCGSGAPNRNTENLLPSIADQDEYLKSHGGVASVLELQLGDDSVPFSEVRDLSGNAHRGSWKTLAVRNAKTNEVVGGWTTVYDEGFEVMLRDKTRLMAFMKYTKNEMCPEAHDGDLEDRNGRTACYETDASKTQLGWYTATAEDGTVKSGCFFAEKNVIPSQGAAPSSLVYVRQRVSEESVDPVGSSTSGFSYYLSKEFVDQHNGKLNSTWKATYNPAFIQQHHTVLSSLIKDFGFSKYNAVGETVQDTRVEDDADPFEVLSPLSMLQSTSSTVAVKKHQHHDSTEPVGASMEQEAASATQSSSLPKAFAWPNPFTEPFFEEQTTNQGGCGSCYAIAAVYALEKRFDIAASRLLGHETSVFSGVQQSLPVQSLLEKSNHRLSPQSVLSCSFYNQGCNGGFPYLVGKHAAELGVLEEGCMPYAASDELRCPSSSHEKSGPADSSSAAFLTTTSEAGTCYAGERRWFAKDYGYVGGCYECGHCAGEENIKAEIYANGPVTAAFDAPASLFSYESGVYDTEDSPHARVCDTPGNTGAPNGLNGWEFTNHAVNIVGWGETEATADAPAQKYWIVRNTWGSKWGNHGYFLLARGKNAGGIESQVSFIDPDFSRGMGRFFLEQIKANQTAALDAV
ncbi:hypothetical protein Emag_004025 [Eimeria magna]